MFLQASNLHLHLNRKIKKYVLVILCQNQKLPNNQELWNLLIRLRRFFLSVRNEFQFLLAQ